MKYNARHAVNVIKRAPLWAKIVVPSLTVAALAAGGAVAAVPSGAATANCPACITVSSQAFGPNVVLNANNKTNIRMRNLSDTYTNEDFVIDGAFHTVDWFVLHGLISPGSFAAINYPNFLAFQLEGAPNGVPNHLCAGLASPAFNGEGVTKVPCGVNAQSLWILDHANGTGGNCLTSGVYCPVVNGSDINFSNPQALTATSDSFQLHVTTENNVGAGGAAGDTQQFAHTP